MEQEELIRDYLIDQKEGMRKVITQFLNDVMREEVAQRIGADHYERTDKRSAYRNGIKKVSFETKVIPMYARFEKALEAAIVESYLQGVSTFAL